MTIAYRIANYDTPFWINPNRSAGRYNRADTGEPTQYLTLHPLGCVAEYLRGQNLTSAGALRERFVRVWVVDLDLSGSPTLTFDNAGEHDLEAADLIADDRAACQSWADRVRADAAMPRVWIVPNAALPGTENVVLFGGRVMSPFSLPAIDGDLDVPATIVGDVSLLPSVVLPQTRFHGHPHVAYEAWKRGESFRYREPARYPLSVPGGAAEPAGATTDVSS